MADTPRKPAKTFQELIVWQRAHDLVLDVYRATCRFPKEELFALTQQMRRAAVSIPANIAEGFPRRTTADKKRFLNIARGSLEEVRYYLILAKDLQYLKTTRLYDEIEEVSRLLHAYDRNIPY